MGRTKKKPLKKCPICDGKLIDEKLNHSIIFITCYTCNLAGIVVDWYHIPKPKRIKLLEKGETMDQKTIDKNFKYHPPLDKQIVKFTEIRSSGKVLAETINKHCPDSREKSIAITKIEEAIMWANASIARKNKKGD
jgi:hypothetical protein